MTDPAPQPSPTPRTSLPGPRPVLSDASMDAGMGRLLQVGVLLASGTVLVGGVLYLRANGGQRASYRSFTSEPASLREPAALMHGLGHGDPAAVIQLGVLLLIATPVARVIFAVVSFALERDRLYVWISVAVLIILLLGLFNLA